MAGHVYGAAHPDLADWCARRALPLRAGLGQNALYLVRPDGYVALADESSPTSSPVVHRLERGDQPDSRNPWRRRRLFTRFL